MQAMDKIKRKKIMGKPLKIMPIPDAQVKPGVDLRYMLAFGYYILAKQPDIIISMGDMVDFPSLSSYDKGKRAAEGQRYSSDVGAGLLGQELLWYAVNDYNRKATRRGAKTYDPLKIFLGGNHEDRADRATQLDPTLFGTIDYRKDLKLHEHWDETYEFLDAISINDVAFNHYFSSGVMGHPCGTAQQQLRKSHMSCISGHQQGRQTFSERSANGKLLTSIIAGSSYDYDMGYLGPQGNKHWRGILLLHSVYDGSFDEVYVPTEYLKNKYVKDVAPIIYLGEK